MHLILLRILALWSVLSQQTLIEMKVFGGGDCSALWAPKLSENKMIHVMVVTLRLSALLFFFFNPSVIPPPPPLLDVPRVAKQYLAKTLLTSREWICCKATTSKNPKTRRRREQWWWCQWHNSFLFWQFWAESGRLQCECVSLYSVAVCIRPVYPLLTTLFYFDPPSVMYTYHDDNDVFKKKNSLSLFQKYQSTSHCLEMTTIQK